MKDRSSLCLMALAIGLAFGAGYAARAPGHGSGAAAMDGEAGHERGGARSLPGEERRLADRSTGGSRGARHGEAGREQPPFAPGQAATWLATMSTQNSDDAFFQAQLAQRCARLDARGAEELAVECLRIGNQMYRDDAVPNSFRDSGVPDAVAVQAFARLAQLDPTRALELIHHSEEDHVNNDVLNVVFSTVAQKDPQQALAVARTLGEGDYESAYEATLRQMIYADPHAMLGQTNLLNGQGMTDLLVDELAKSDPPAAMDFARSTLLDHNDRDALRALARGDQQTQQQIQDWAATYAGPGKEKARAYALELLSGGNVAEPREYYAKLQGSLPEDQRAEAAAAVAKSMLQRDHAPDDAKAWVDGLGEGPARDAAMTALVNTALGSSYYGIRSGSGAINRNNIDAVLNNPDRLISGQCRTNADFIAPIDGAPLPNALPTTMISFRSTGSYNPSQAEQWISGMPASDLRSDLTVRLIGTLQNSDANRALQWIDTLPDGAQKETLKRETELKMQLRELQQSQLQWGDPDGGTSAGAGAIIGRQ